MFNFNLFWFSALRSHLTSSMGLHLLDNLFTILFSSLFVLNLGTWPQLLLPPFLVFVSFKVLYVGDHIYGDILRSKKALGIILPPFCYSRFISFGQLCVFVIITCRLGQDGGLCLLFRSSKERSSSYQS